MGICVGDYLCIIEGCSGGECILLEMVNNWLNNRKPHNVEKNLEIVYRDRETMRPRNGIMYTLLFEMMLHCSPRKKRKKKEKRGNNSE